MKKQLKTVLMMSAVVAASLLFASCNNNGSKENSNAAPEEHKHAEGVQHEHVEKALEKGNFQMQFSSSPQIIEAGKPTTLTFTPKNKDNTNESVPLDVEHEKKIHLIVVSEDLSWFSHIHPEYQADGSYSVTETFPNGGNYILYADYKPTGRSTQLEKIQVSVKGAAKKPVTYSEARLVSQVDGYEVKFVNGSELKANNEGHLIINIEKNGKLISPSELEKYLGSNAHIVFIGQDDKEYLHVHPEANEFPIHAHSMVPKPGIYRMWLQFQTNGKVHTADFIVKVAEGVAEDGHAHTHQHDMNNMESKEEHKH